MAGSACLCEGGGRAGDGQQRFFPELDLAWKAWLPASSFPVRATVGVADLGGDARVEIAITAHQ